MKIQGFLLLPELNNIAKEPVDPYPYATSGKIHAVKFKQLFSYLIEDKSRGYLDEIFSGHLIQEKILNFSEEDLADLCRHIIFINKSSFHHLTFSSLLAELNEKYIPKWSLPNIDLNDDILQLFSNLINWDINQDIEKLLILLINEEDFYLTNKTDILGKIQSHIQFWSLWELFHLYDNLINFLFREQNLAKQKQYAILTTSLTNIFFTLIEKNDWSLSTRMIFTLLFARTYSKLGSDEVIEAEKLIDKYSEKVSKLSNKENVTYKFIFGASYSIIGNEIFKSNFDLISRRRILAGLISKFINPEGINLVQWLEILVSVKPHVSLFSLIVDGYTQLIDMFKAYCVELPDGETKQENILMLKELVISLMKTSIEIFKSKFSLDINEYTNMKKFLKSCISKSEMKIIAKEIFTSILKLINFYIQLNLSEEKEFSKLLSLGYEINHEFYGEHKALLYKIDMQLQLGKVPFQEILSKIENDIKSTSSIILSGEFENQIIRVISHMIGYSLQESKFTDIINIEDYEIILHYASEWLQVLKTSPSLYYEGLMVLGPIISICFVQITRGYFQRSQKEKAFLTYMSMHYFLEITNQESRRVSMMNVDKLKSEKKNNIQNRYKQLIKELNLKELLNIKDIKTTFIDFELSLNKSSFSGGSSSLSGMLEDDLVFGYMDLAKELEDFIEKETKSHQGHPTLNYIYSSGLYKKPVLNSVNRLDKIGSVIMGKNILELPFPLVRNVHILAIALHLFPIDMELSTIVQESNLYASLIEIFTDIE